MIDIVNSNARVIEGEKRYPYMYGDNGWYDFKPEPVPWGTLESWFWTMEDKDKARVENHPWVSYLEGRDPDYPTRELAKDFETIRNRVAGMRADTTTPDTRLSDDPMKFNPASVNTLNQLMMGGMDPGRGGAALHCRLRYFDPESRRAGIPDDIAALIDKFSDSEVSVILVNTSPTAARDLIIQAGAYGEHNVSNVLIGNESVTVDGPYFRVKIDPGCGARLIVSNDRYTEKPTMAFPWDRD